MHGRIELSGDIYDVTVIGRSPDRLMRIGDGLLQVAALEALDSGEWEIRLGGERIRARMGIKGEMAYIRAFGQTFALRVINPVEQAATGTGGGGRSARAPMPGVVVDIHVAEGDAIVRGQPLMTIESMKILTAITAPSGGNVEKVHFSTGQPFEKGAVLVTLCPEGR